MALRFWRALRASGLYGTEAHKGQKIIGDTVGSGKALPQSYALQTNVLSQIIIEHFTQLTYL